MISNAPRVLRHLMREKSLLWGPGVYDGISARIANKVGFDVLFLTGAGVSASRLGQPDVGLITVTELSGSAGAVQSVIDVPLLADAEQGFGGVANVVRTVHLFEAAGVAGIRMEDQVSPKRCAHLSNVTVVDRMEFLAKIRAAVQERYNPEFVIVARSDATEQYGLEEAIARIDEAFSTGADVGVIEGLRSRDQIERVARSLCDRPMWLGQTTNGKTPSLTVEEIRSLGFKFACWASSTRVPAAIGISEALTSLKKAGTDRCVYSTTPHEFLEWMGLEGIVALGARYEGEVASG